MGLKDEKKTDAELNYRSGVRSERNRVIRLLERQAVAAHDRGNVILWAAFNGVAELIEHGPKQVHLNDDCRTRKRWEDR